MQGWASCWQRTENGNRIPPTAVLWVVKGFFIESQGRIRLSVSKGDVIRVNGTLPMDVAAYLLNKKRKELADVENRYGVSIILQGDPSIPPGGGKLDFVRGEEG